MLQNVLQANSRRKVVSGKTGVESHSQSFCLIELFTFGSEFVARQSGKPHNERFVFHEICLNPMSDLFRERQANGVRRPEYAAGVHLVRDIGTRHAFQNINDRRHKQSPDSSSCPSLAKCIHLLPI